MNSASQFRPAGADLTQERGVGGQLQRNQGTRRPQQHQALCTADRGRPLLAGSRRPGLLSHHHYACGGEETQPHRLRPPVRADGGCARHALIAVFDAKYHYEFWRPITAIRNGDIDDNPATERDAAWQPMEATPMHPEYPCAHCIESASLAGVVQAVFGTAEIPEVSMTSPTAPGLDPPLDQRARFHRRGFASAYLVRLPLPLLDQGRPGHGLQDRRVRGEERHAAR